MKTDYTAKLPLDAIGALELGRKQEAILIVRDELAIDQVQASDLVERYLSLHPLHPLPVAGLDNSSRWLWTMLAGLAMITVSGLMLLG